MDKNEKPPVTCSFKAKCPEKNSTASATKPEEKELHAFAFIVKEPLTSDVVIVLPFCNECIMKMKKTTPKLKTSGEMDPSGSIQKTYAQSFPWPEDRETKLLDSFLDFLCCLCI